MPAFSASNPDKSTDLYRNDTYILIGHEETLSSAIEQHGTVFEGQITESDRGSVIVSTDPEVLRSLAEVANHLADELEEQIEAQTRQFAAEDEIERAIDRHEPAQMDREVA